MPHPRDPELFAAAGSEYCRLFSRVSLFSWKKLYDVLNEIVVFSLHL